MKTTIITVLAFFGGLTLLTAQWTNDPLNPQLVSNGTCAQSGVQQCADGNGGSFVFWLDSRLGCSSGNNYDVYGQHYDANGYEIWESGGREILSNTGSISIFKVLRTPSDAEMVIAWLTLSDSLRVQKLDGNGAKMWSSDLLVGKYEGCAPPTYILGISSFRLMRDNLGYCIAMEAIYCGGANGHRITRFDSSGNLTGPFNGEPEGSQYYSGAWGIDKTYDGSNDEYLYYTDGNGAGAHARAMRVNLAGDTAWGPLDVLSGTNGLNYFYDAMSDDSGIAVLFQSNGSNGTGVDIYMRKLNPDGSWAWGGATVEVGAADGTQGQPHWQQDDSYYYVCWADGRTGVSPGYWDIYAQKIDKTTGSVQWAANGVEVFSQNTYIPYPKCVVTPSGEMIITNESNLDPFAFNAQMLNPDGSISWANTALLCNTVHSPFYSDYQLIITNLNIIAVWAKINPIGGADGIYISRFHTLPEPCPEDLNGDGTVNTTDLLLFMGQFGCLSGCGSADLNSDGVINTTDLLLFMGAFGSLCP